MALPARTSRFLEKRTLAGTCVCFPFALLGLLGFYADASVAAQEISSFPWWTGWIARGVSLAVYAAALLAALKSPRVFANRPLIVAAGASLAVGVALTLWFAGLFGVFVLAQTLVGLGSAWLLACWGAFLGSFGPATRRRVVIAGGALAAIIGLLSQVMPVEGARVWVLAVALGCSVPLTWFRDNLASHGCGSCCGSDDVQPAASGQAERPQGAIQSLQGAGMRIGWELALLMVCYAFMFRILQNFDYATGIAASLTKTIVILAALAGSWAYLVRPLGRGTSKQTPRSVSPLLFLLATCGLALIPFTDAGVRSVFAAVAGACWPLFYYLLWMMLLEAADVPSEGPAARPANTPSRHAQVFCLGWLVLNVALIAAAPLASALARQVDAGTLSLTALVLVLGYTILVATLLARRGHDVPRSSQPSNVTVEPDEKPAGLDVASSFDALCTAIADAHNLTERERDVLRLLARGRSVPVICDALSISQSTAKGHVKHIYEKVGVANKQELLGLFEPGDGR